jgi:hypothetical protein
MTKLHGKCGGKPETVARNNRARRSRRNMLKALGGYCYHCGTTENVTFDTITPTGINHRDRGPSGADSHYVKQLRAGNLQLLCGRHNSQKWTGPNLSTPFAPWRLRHRIKDLHHLIRD